MQTKGILGIIVMGSVLFLAACTTKDARVYGVPQSQWEQMSAQQQQRTIEIYTRQQNLGEGSQQVLDAMEASSHSTELDHRPSGKCGIDITF